MKLTRTGSAPIVTGENVYDTRRLLPPKATIAVLSKVCFYAELLLSPLETNHARVLHTLHGKS